MLGERCRSQASASCIGLLPIDAAAASSSDDCRGSESSQREERHIGDALLREMIDDAVIVSLRHVVEILHANDLRNLLALSQLPGTDVAKAEMTNEPLLLELRQHGQGFFDGFVGWRHDSSDPEVDDVE